MDTKARVAARTVAAPDGTALHVEAFGPEDGLPVVLIHGRTCAIRFWTGQIHDLAATHRVIAYDPRGHDEVRRRAAGVALLNTGVGDLVTESLVVRMPGSLGKVKARIGRHVLGAQAPLPPASPISARALRYGALCGEASPG